MKKLFSTILIVSLAFVATSRADEQETVDHCAGVVRDFRHMPEKAIPREVLRHARGLAIITVVKAGFIFSGKAGHGVVVARTRHGWSGPSFIGTGGAGWGLQIGAQATDFIFVLNNRDAVRAFSRGGNVTLGADASVAAGPAGRNAEGLVTPTAAIYTYSRSRGLFAGVSLEGAVIGTKKDENGRYYQRPVTANEILDGRVAPPARAARLHAALGY
jgi:lipid-binding SYLF domain-containing protein